MQVFLVIMRAASSAFWSIRTISSAVQSPSAIYRKLMSAERYPSPFRNLWRGYGVAGSIPVPVIPAKELVKQGKEPRVAPASLPVSAALRRKRSFQDRSPRPLLRCRLRRHTGRHAGAAGIISSWRPNTPARRVLPFLVMRFGIAICGLIVSRKARVPCLTGD